MGWFPDRRDCVRSSELLLRGVGLAASVPNHAGVGCVQRYRSHLLDRKPFFEHQELGAPYNHGPHLDSASGQHLCLRGEFQALKVKVNITVNAVIPGLIDTPLTRHHERYAQILDDSGRSPTGSSADKREAQKILALRTPLGVPWIEPEDVALVVVFLASEAPRAWFPVRLTMSQAATAPTTQHNYATRRDGTTESDLPPIPQSAVRAGQVAERVARPFAVSHRYPISRSCHSQRTRRVTA
jgi:hypothetical protein